MIPLNNVLSDQSSQTQQEGPRKLFLGIWEGSAEKVRKESGRKMALGFILILVQRGSTQF